MEISYYTDYIIPEVTPAISLIIPTKLILPNCLFLCRVARSLASSRHKAHPDLRTTNTTVSLSFHSSGAKHVLFSTMIPFCIHFNETFLNIVKSPTILLPMYDIFFKI